jgi:hypothetical protein
MPVIEVDFTGVETGAGFLAPGVYEAQVQNVEKRDGRNYPGLKFTWASVEPETEGQRSDQFISLAPQALWKFKGLLEAFGAEIPQSILRFDTDRLIGKRAMVHVIAEPWKDSEGVEKTSSKVDTVHQVRKTGEPPAQKPQAVVSEQAVVSDFASIDGPTMAEDDDIPF